nr:MAG TPA: hypothetical protein [Caudoviricetes sp.]
MYERPPLLNNGQPLLQQALLLSCSPFVKLSFT